jgi:glycosyltransferase involved in cell wall biosynthesis
MVKISVIIPAFNEEKFLGNCLLSLKEQNFNDFEIIVVDNNSTDKTAEIAKKFGVILVSEKNQGVAFARNKGAKVAKGEILAFTDADTILPKNWLSRIQEEFENNKELVAFGGSCEFYSGPISARLASKFLLKPFLFLDKFFSGGFNLMGCNMAIKKEVFLKVGGFNEKLKLNEDVEISYRLRKLGKIKFDPNFKVKTSGRRFRHGLILGIINYAPATIFRWFFKKFDKFQIFPAQRKEGSLVGNLSLFFSLFFFIFLFFHFLNPGIAIAKNLVKKEINKLVFTERKIKIKVENEFGKVKNLPPIRQKFKLRNL